MKEQQRQLGLQMLQPIVSLGSQQRGSFEPGSIPTRTRFRKARASRNTGTAHRRHLLQRFSCYSSLSMILGAILSTCAATKSSRAVGRSRMGSHCIGLIASASKYHRCRFILAMIPAIHAPQRTPSAQCSIPPTAPLLLSLALY